MGIAPACTTRAIVRSVAICDQFPEASTMQKTLLSGDKGLQRGERHANACESTGDEESLAPGFFDGFDPRRAVPCVDLAGTRNLDRVRIVLVNLRDAPAGDIPRRRNGSFLKVGRCVT